MASLFILVLGIVYSFFVTFAFLKLLSMIAEWAGWESPKEEVVSPAPTPHKKAQAGQSSNQVSPLITEKEPKSTDVPFVPPSARVPRNKHNTPAAPPPKVLRRVHPKALGRERAPPPPETPQCPSATKADATPSSDRDRSIAIILELAECQRIPFAERIEDAIRVYSEARTRGKGGLGGVSSTAQLTRRRLIQFVQAAVHTSRQEDLIAGFPEMPVELIAKYMDLDHDIREAAARWIHSSYCRSRFRSAARLVPKRPSEWDTDMSGASSSWDMVVRSYEDLGTDL
jgi:hypothetical protein